ncbi:hypothetical protein TUSST3_08910 [Streptomyces sp. TUS-ST3]|uniref:hypothetical protein n=1 Tax=Streptomyces sp. TUS-ST3 TaxID=3025591 RepID=UPI0024E11D19|nr:hypothetical protein [Streptomyces sp. TUS-ST3]GLP64271.1 hypothetical protein TUSST3_08910 [Streptomyces sp. TUS-ST3]
MTRRKPAVRALHPSVQERLNREAAIDALIQRALRGVITIPEAAVLAEYVRADRRAADKTRKRLTETTQALQRHREAAAAAIQQLEDHIAELTNQQQETAA